METEIILTAILIVIARIIDVSCGTLRTVCIMRNMRVPALVLGFFESLIWVLAISKVASNLDRPIYILCFALGFALGNYIGITIERKLAIGNQVLRIFTRNSEEMIQRLRSAGRKVTKFSGEGKDGTVDLLLLELPRKSARKIIELVTTTDPKAYFFIDEVSHSSDLAGRIIHPLGWWNTFRKK